MTTAVERVERVGCSMVRRSEMEEGLLYQSSGDTYYLGFQNTGGKFSLATCSHRGHTMFSKFVLW